MQIKTHVIKFQAIKIHLTKSGPPKGGSVALFVHNSLNYKERPNVSKSNDITEICPLKLSIKTENYCLWYVEGTRQ